MDHERAFLQAIREEPDEDAHRLIYADWLEEQGGAGRTARAAFIRAQCHLAALPDDDPNRDALEDEAADVLAEYEREWTEPLRGLATSWKFSRGFLERITIRGEDFLTHAERLFDFAPIRNVHLLLHLRDAPRLAACPFLQRIETLDFRRCHLNDRALQHLLASPNLTRLRALNLGGNNINTPGVRSLIDSPVLAGLRRLDLSGNFGVRDVAIRLLAQASAAENLEDLNLAGTAPTLDCLRELFQSSHLPRLTHLNIAQTRSYRMQRASPLPILAESRLLRQLRSLDISAHDDSFGLQHLLSHSLEGSQLQALYLHDTSIPEPVMEVLVSSPHLRTLRILDVGQTSVGGRCLQMLAESPNLAGLTRLNLASSNLRDDGAKTLAQSPYLRSLKQLDLSGNGIGGPGLQAFAASANFQRLRTLHLGGNFIGAESVRALTQSSDLTQLRELDLRDAYLEEDSARALAESPNLALLRKLLLAKNLLGDGGARLLAQSPHLKRLSVLDLNDNRIGKAGAEALAAAPHWRHLRSLDLRGNVFTDTQETLLRDRFGDAVRL